MWHMPRRTYAKLNRHADGTFAQEASARVDHAYMMRDRVMPYEIHNYAHNNEWLVRNLVYTGRVRDAIDLAKNMIELPRHPKFTRSTGAEFGRARLFDVLSLHELWPQLLELIDTPYLNETPTPAQRVRRLRYLGVAAAATGQRELAMEQVLALEAMRAKLRVEMYETAAKAEADARAAKKKPAEVKKARQDARREKSDLVKEIERAVAHVAGQQAIAAGDHASAVEQWALAEVPKEHLARLHLRAGDPAKAIDVARAATEDKANQVYPLASYVDVLYRAGKTKEAKAAFDRLRPLSASIDHGTSIYASLKEPARAFGYDRDWRRPRTIAADVGQRPNLDALGPFRWGPSPAPDFNALAADGTTLLLSTYRGKPVVVLFYLGYGCLHCTRQLQAFAPLTADFAAAGVSLVAISTDAPADLHRAWQAAKLDGKAFPFPLASDAKFDVFRRYHCFDDFENVPLHGTFLIDAAGRIRWRDVGAEPFTDTAFLLAETKRLLSQP